MKYIRIVDDFHKYGSCLVRIMNFLRCVNKRHITLCNNYYVNGRRMNMKLFSKERFVRDEFFVPARYVATNRLDNIKFLDADEG